jgi:hypothetical protein
MSFRAYVVQQGDYLDQLATAHGFDAEEVWNDARNDELRRVRSNPAMLAPGDVIHFPREPQQRPSCASRSTNRYRGSLPTVTVEITFGDPGSPLANEPFVVEGLAQPFSGRTDGAGRARFEAPVSARSVVIELTELGVAHQVRIGHLDPPDTPSGTRQRLRHLGYYGHWIGGADEPEPGEERDRRALAWFQRDQRLEPTGDADTATRQKLAEVHGG